jgi:hypothetical protein
MTRPFQSIRELLDTRSEVLATIILLFAVVFELREFSDAATVAMFLLATGLLGYTRRAQAGPFSWELKDGEDSND